MVENNNDKTYTIEEHDDEKRSVSIIQDSLYDVTKYLNQHRGGSLYILSFAEKTLRSDSLIII